MSWTEGRCEQLKALWDEGHSASQIGRVMGMTRNSVIGKVHRLGLDGRAKAPPRPAYPRGVWRRPRVAEPPLTPPQIAALIDGDPPLTDDPFGPHGCRWVIGDPGEIVKGGGSVRFCQRDKHRSRENGVLSMWCKGHHALVYKRAA